MSSFEEINEEILECARYGEEEELRQYLSAGGNVNYADESGNTALHKAAANGHVGCLRILHEFGAQYLPNNNGNYPTHWAAQNSQAGALAFLSQHFSVDVLSKNNFGRTVLTEAFQSSCSEVIEQCLTHDTASEDKLLPDTPNVSLKEDGADNSVTHEFQLLGKDSAPPVMKIRELPITRADNPFGNDEAPENDTTGLAVWPASLLLAQYLSRHPEICSNKQVIELGAGCGVPAIAAALYSTPTSVTITDIHQPTLDNLAYNLSINTFSMNVTSKFVNWVDASTFPAPADVVLGSDLVYDANILSILVPAIDAMLLPGGAFVYIAPTSERAGMDNLVTVMEAARMKCVSRQLCDEELYANPLLSREEDQYMLHFYDMATKSPFMIYNFVKE